MGAPLLLSSFLTRLIAAAAAAVGSTIAEAGLGWWCVRLMCCGKSSTNFWQIGQRVTLRLSKCCFVGTDTAAVASSNAKELSGSSVWSCKYECVRWSNRYHGQSWESPSKFMTILVQIEPELLAIFTRETIFTC